MANKCTRCHKVFDTLKLYGKKDDKGWYCYPCLFDIDNGEGAFHKITGGRYREVTKGKDNG